VSGSLVGKRVPRLEDARLLKGEGRYTDDLEPQALHAAFLRAEPAHARIVDIDVSGALEIEGLHAIWTSEDLEGPFAEPLPFIPHPGIVAPRTQHALARDEICYAGEIVAMVVADDRYVAEDAVACIHVDYEPLPVTADLEAAAQPGGARAHVDMTDNVAAVFSEDVGDIDAALASAPHVWSWRFEIERSAAMPMECRAVVARYDERERMLLVWDSTQAPNNIRRGLARLFELDVERVQVVAPDVGGGFGVKVMQFYPEEVLVPWAARRLGVAVKWAEDRREHFIGSNHERKQIHDVRVGVDGDGRLLGLETRFVHDSGAYCPYGLIIPILTAAHIPGPYRLPSYRYEFRSIFTNTVPTSVYRGAGRPHAAFVIERVLDRVAIELGLDRAEVRRRNLVQPDEFPYDVGVTLQDGSRAIYDSGDYPWALETLLREIKYGGFPEEKAAAAAAGRRLGLGIAANVENTGIGPYEGAAVSVMPDGSVTVATGLSSQGQSHETVFAQIVADQLGVALDRIHVVTGDTRRVGQGVGTFSSRASVVAGSAVHQAAAEVRHQAQELASLALEAAAEDIELIDGFAQVAGVPSTRVALGHLAASGNPLRFGWTGEDRHLAERIADERRRTDGRGLPLGSTPGLSALEYFSPPSPTFSYGMHAVVLEVDSQTCDLRILRYVVVHDCGTVLNPLVVEGQIQGGLAQGIGGAFYEQMAYDDEGQLQNASFMDFLIPYATEVPTATIRHTETPSPTNVLGVKGAGEAGTIPVSAAIANAIGDALGLAVDRMPLSPLALYEALADPRAEPGNDAGHAATGRRK
jgi:CO/xanthine dehydrogenase Mo-binding subunit